MLNTTFFISDDHLVYNVGNILNNSGNNTHIPRLIEGLCDIKTINGCTDHILCLDLNGNVFCFGNNYDRQLGFEEYFYKLKKIVIPQKIDIPPCKQIACGRYFSMCLTEDNLLYSFESNNIEIGSGDNINYNSPRLIPNLHNIEYIVCGYEHTICKRYDNTYYGWGDNHCGQLGHIGYENYNEPTLCNNFPDDIISIKCGDYHTLLLTLEGKLYSLGNNNCGQLGLNDNDIKKNKYSNINYKYT